VSGQHQETGGSSGAPRYPQGAGGSSGAAGSQQPPPPARRGRQSESENEDDHPRVKETQGPIKFPELPSVGKIEEWKMQVYQNVITAAGRRDMVAQT